ncbi:hypothetical protein, partial [Endozoicomonas sp. SESOKO3]|uniref:hypothetical protein n=1 Tax=Endozoicomonas sp. SESOKO3 TaxID=2828744 RepID=UPI00214874E3
MFVTLIPPVFGVLAPSTYFRPPYLVWGNYPIQSQQQISFCNRFDWLDQCSGIFIHGIKFTTSAGDVFWGFDSYLFREHVLLDWLVNIIPLASFSYG